MALDPLNIIQQYENAPADPTAKNPTSSASGLYQIIDATWQRWAGAIGVSTSQYPTAASAPAAVQQAVAAYGFNTEGFTPWTVGNNALAAAIGAAGGASAFGTACDPTPIPDPNTGGFQVNPCTGTEPGGGPAGLGAAAAHLSPLSAILDAIGGAGARFGVGVLGVILIAIGAWALARGRDPGDVAAAGAGKVGRGLRKAAGGLRSAPARVAA